MNRFRVLQFNMQYGQRWDDVDPDNAPIRLDATLAEIQAHHPDVVLLQEVEQAQPNGVQLQPPPNFTRLQSELGGYGACFAYPKADARELPFGVGLAIFSRGGVHGFTRVELPSPPIPFEFMGRKLTPTDRVLIGAKTTLFGREIQLLNTHLLAFFMLGASSSENPEQRNLVAEQLRAARGPAILAGDFNIRRHDTVVAQFAECGFRTVQDREVTWRRQPYVLDHIFHNDALRCVGHRIVPTRASDHHALVADFEFA